MTKLSALDLALKHEGFDRIGRIDAVGRRSLWMKVNQARKEITLRAGREGDDAQVVITSMNPLFSDLDNVLSTAHFAAEWEDKDGNALMTDEELVGADLPLLPTTYPEWSVDDFAQLEEKLVKRLDELPIGGVLGETFKGHRLLFVKTRLDGIHTGRSRFTVCCDSCDALMHHATTGPVERAYQHILDKSRKP